MKPTLPLFRIAYWSPTLDGAPSKWLISKPITILDLFDGESVGTQVDFIGGGYLRYDEMTRAYDADGKICFDQWTGATVGRRKLFVGDIVREEWDAPAGHMLNTFVVRQGTYEDGEGCYCVGFYGRYTPCGEQEADESGFPLSSRSYDRGRVIGNVHNNADLLTA